MFSKENQIELVRKLDEKVSALAFYLFPTTDSYVRGAFADLEKALADLKQSFKDPYTYVKLVERDSGDVVMKYFDKGEVADVCAYAAKHYAFDDIDDTYRIDEIMCDGHELCYMGWRPGMRFMFKDLVTGEVVFDWCYPHWDHQTKEENKNEVL